jgi:hypothetical protein
MLKTADEVQSFFNVDIDRPLITERSNWLVGPINRKRFVAKELDRCINQPRVNRVFYAHSASLI